MGMFDGVLDKAMATAGPMFDKLVEEFEAMRATLTADTAQDAATQEAIEAQLQATQALTAQVHALRASIVAANKLARSQPTK
jgi:hypothetical protein